jgi:hypothetical protein
MIRIQYKKLNPCYLKNIFNIKKLIDMGDICIVIDIQKDITWKYSKRK